MNQNGDKIVILGLYYMVSIIITTTINRGRNYTQECNDRALVYDTSLSCVHMGNDAWTWACGASARICPCIATNGLVRIHFDSCMQNCMQDNCCTCIISYLYLRLYVPIQRKENGVRGFSPPPPLCLYMITVSVHVHSVSIHVPLVSLHVHPVSMQKHTIIMHVHSKHAQLCSVIIKRGSRSFKAGGQGFRSLEVICM